MDMKENTRKLVYNILAGKTKQIKDSLNQTVSKKLNSQLNQKKQQIAKDLLKK
jgi:hypothetical protein